MNVSIEDVKNAFPHAVNDIEKLKNKECHTVEFPCLPDHESSTEI